MHLKTTRRGRRVAAVTLGLAVAMASTTTAAEASGPDTPSAGVENWQSLPAGAAPASDPLEGFIPYAGSYTTFPHSMEWFYLPVNAVMSGPQTFDWTALDDQLNAIASRGHHAAFRFYLDLPTKPSGIPQYLLDGGLRTHSYNDYGNNGVSVSPDYDDPNLDQALDTFIAALGQRYDGDPRIGFLELGLLGFWGEWHTYPYDGEPGTENWFASPAEQHRALTDFDAAFDKTKLQVRYPSTDNEPMDMGYHDDSFAYSTLPGPGWHFLDLMQQAGATDKWQTEPIGGELLPSLQGCLFDAASPCPDGPYDYASSVSQSHASWLLDQGAFSPGYSGATQDAALQAAQSLGYRLRVTDADLAAGQCGELTVGVRMRDDGVAPFYYDWPLQVGAVDQGGRLVKSWDTSWRLTTVTPDAPQEWTSDLDTAELPPGQYTMVLRAATPLPGGADLRFANAGQDTTLSGWLTLGTVHLPR